MAVKAHSVTCNLCSRDQRGR